MHKIDFVIPWVDGSDKDWQNEKKKWEEKSGLQINASSNSEERYRDWDNLRYWFRGVELYAPWVNNVFFITNGQKPKWLNINHPKLKFIKHTDYIPIEYLPTFSSHVIEINLHRIKELSEHFVYFNDDTFLLRKIKPEHFFKNGKPVLPAALQPIYPFNDCDDVLGHIYFNMFSAINRNFKMKKSIHQNKSKWLSFQKIGIKNTISNLFFMQYPEFIGFKREHLPCPIMKTTIQNIWKKEFALLDKTSHNRFRTSDDVNQYLFRYWELASGNFEPGCFVDKGSCVHLSEKNNKYGQVVDSITNQKYDMICINDAYKSFEGFQIAKKQINGALQKLLMTKSSFELF